MKQALCAILALTVILFTFSSCAKQVSNAELQQAYLVYIEAPSTLSKVISTSESDTLISESHSNESGSYTRKTEVNQADKNAIITSTFKDFHPVGVDAITVNGTAVLTTNKNNFFLNGELNYKGILPARLVFKNVHFEQSEDSEGVIFIPKGGSILADKREIESGFFFTQIVK